jgi:hypothetical protein
MFLSTLIFHIDINISVDQKPEITLPLLFDDYAQRYATRPGGYTRIHPYGNRSGDNAPHAIIELVDGPHDLKFEMTARAVGRETVEAALANAAGPSSSGVAFSDIGTGEVPLRDLTKLNLSKALRYRSDEDRQRFRKIAADWAVGVTTLDPRKDAEPHGDHRTVS